MGGPIALATVAGLTGPKAGAFPSLGLKKARHLGRYQVSLGLVRRGRVFRGWMQAMSEWRRRGRLVWMPQRAQGGKGVGQQLRLQASPWSQENGGPSRHALLSLCCVCCLLPPSMPSPGRRIFLAPRFQCLRSPPACNTAPDTAGARWTWPSDEQTHSMCASGTQALGGF